MEAKKQKNKVDKAGKKTQKKKNIFEKKIQWKLKKIFLFNTLIKKKFNV